MTESLDNLTENDFTIKLGSVDDRSKIEDFAFRLSEDPISSAEKWIKIIQEENVYPLLAEIDHKIIGKGQVRIVGDVAWLESARVDPKYRKQGVAIALLDEAFKYISNHQVKYIRAAVDSDNMKIRILLEKNKFTGHYILINPNAHIEKSDTSPAQIAKFSNLIDTSVFSSFNRILQEYFSGNIMIEGQYIPFSEELFIKLVQERRILTNGDSKSFLITSNHKMDEQLEAFVFAESEEMYKELGLLSKALAAQELAKFLEVHAPAKRTAVKGLVEAGLGWNQPHTLIIYQKNNNS